MLFNTVKAGIVGMMIATQSSRATAALIIAELVDGQVSLKDAGAYSARQQTPSAYDIYFGLAELLYFSTPAAIRQYRAEKRD